MLEYSCKWSGTRPKHPCVLLPSHLAGSDAGAGGVEGCCQDVFWHEGQAGLRGRVRHKVVSWGGLPCLIYGTLVEERGGGGEAWFIVRKTVDLLGYTLVHSKSTFYSPLFCISHIV